VGISNNINSFVPYMLLIQYLQFIVLPGGWQFAFCVFGYHHYHHIIFVFIYDLHCCLLSLFIF